jgi:nucleotide-binding universal stress UspA family protein
VKEHWPCHNVLVAVDLVGEVRRAEQADVLRRAVELAGDLGASVRLLHAVPGAERLPGETGGDEFSHYLVKMAQEDVAKLQSAAGTHFEASVVAGGVGPVLRQVAEDHHADLVIIGRGVMHATFGRLRSKSYQIIRESPCPVLSL